MLHLLHLTTSVAEYTEAQSIDRNALTGCRIGISGGGSSLVLTLIEGDMKVGVDRVDASAELGLPEVVLGRNSRAKKDKGTPAAVYSKD